MSPADLGKVVWVRADGFDWYGPCLAVDVAARTDFLGYVNDLHEIAEVGKPLRDLFGFESSVPGEIWVGQCPRENSMPMIYRVKPEYSRELTPSFYPYPKQEMPRECAQESRKH